MFPGLKAWSEEMEEREEELQEALRDKGEALRDKGEALKNKSEALRNKEEALQEKTRQYEKSIENTILQLWKDGNDREAVKERLISIFMLDEVTAEKKMVLFWQED